MTPVQPNGTVAKEIAIYFLKQTGRTRFTPHLMSKTIRQVKSTLSAGYTQDEIIQTIDYNIKKGIDMYSFGYINASIDDVLREVSKNTKDEHLEQQMKEYLDSKREAVNDDSKTRSRNQEKARRFGVQSRKREKFNFDMFEE